MYKLPSSGIPYLACITKITLLPQQYASSKTFGFSTMTVARSEMLNRMVKMDAPIVLPASVAMPRQCDLESDGINDAPSLKKADCVIAVEGASEAAQSATDIVLLEPGLSTMQLDFSSDQINLLMEQDSISKVFIL
ncbi:hypothetical protein POJ06DRAFT_265215 [Lipomyces tetrasporus]|uniref:Uncharacterized protein n=1 Tax=Lipomyces tetrasporus TaxID=54092 RepID=A0AAD7QZK0_9ASCO|nr:uncharacterized protein POJ06DRAFT_265215 [Lipomyces tetrasporus]KAJ8104386.1 hypothetical protein POJ06DRAFT_265215 [Lipomyces tetrasporus]